MLERTSARQNEWALFREMRCPHSAHLLNQLQIFKTIRLCICLGKKARLGRGIILKHAFGEKSQGMVAAGGVLGDFQIWVPGGFSAKFLQAHGPIPCPSSKMQNICFSAATPHMSSPRFSTVPHSRQFFPPPFTFSITFLRSSTATNWKDIHPPPLLNPSHPPQSWGGWWWS